MRGSAMRTLLCLFAAAFVVPTLSATTTVRKVAMQRRRIVAAVILADSRAPRRSWKNRWSQRLDWYVCAAMASWYGPTCAL